LPGRPARSNSDRRQVASIDQISGGRFLFGIGHGWEQGRDGQPRHRFRKPSQGGARACQAMKEIWTTSKAEYHGKFVNFDPMDDLAEAGPEAASADHRRRAFRSGARHALR
jgi:alkanesulfonate monooxygenase SsuD/methylene tetrahydromethanopterin reductase-like flavin-dependent oxidoreductase (luciferase family)